MYMQYQYIIVANTHYAGCLYSLDWTTLFATNIIANYIIQKHGLLLPNTLDSFQMGRANHFWRATVLSSGI